MKIEQKKKDTAIDFIDNVIDYRGDYEAKRLP